MEPLDLTASLGEGWCVTLVSDRTPDETLQILGVPQPVTGGLATIGQVNVIAAHEVAPGWTMAVECNGILDWLAMADGALQDLSAGDRFACCALSNPNRWQVWFSASAMDTTAFEPNGGWLYPRHGDGLGPTFERDLRQAGFIVGSEPDDYDLESEPPAADDLSRSQAAVLILKALTGVEIKYADDNGWRVGVGHPDQVRAARDDARSGAANWWMAQDDFWPTLPGDPDRSAE